MKNAIFRHFIDFRPIWACPYVINIKIYNFQTSLYNNLDQ